MSAAWSDTREQALTSPHRPWLAPGPHRPTSDHTGPGWPPPITSPHWPWLALAGPRPSPALTWRLDVALSKGDIAPLVVHAARRWSLLAQTNTLVARAATPIPLRRGTTASQCTSEASSAANVAVRLVWKPVAHTHTHTHTHEAHIHTQPSRQHCTLPSPERGRGDQPTAYSWGYKEGTVAPPPTLHMTLPPSPVVLVTGESSGTGYWGVVGRHNTEHVWPTQET